MPLSTPAPVSVRVLEPARLSVVWLLFESAVGCAVLEV
jgi:hypothetical protein